MVKRKFAAKKKTFTLGERLKGFFQLTRPANCLMAAIAVIIGFYVANGPANVWVLGMAVLSVALVCGGGQAINDYFDAKIDAKKSKERPIPSGRVKPVEALIFSLALLLIGVIAASTINPLSLLIAIIFAILLTAYPLYMNKVKYIGNIIVALGTAFTFIYGASAAGYIPLLVGVLALSAFFSNMAREVTKDIEDMGKDKGAKKTLPLIIGKENAIAFPIAYYAAAIVLSLAAFFYFYLSIPYLLFALIGAAIFVKSALVLSKHNAKKSQKLSKMGMAVSLIAFIFAGF